VRKKMRRRGELSPSGGRTEKEEGNEVTELREEEMGREREIGGSGKLNGRESVDEG
jgi:hypothetical protein